MTLFVGAALALSAVARPSARPLSRPFAARLTSPLNHDFADPFVLRQDETYYAFATGVAGWHVQVATSRDLTSWTRWRCAASFAEVGIAQRRVHVGPRRSSVRDRHYVLYYTARHLALAFNVAGRSPIGPRSLHGRVDAPSCVR